MDLLVFSGNSQRNRDYGLEVQKRLNSSYFQDYQHWHDGQEWINLPHELEVLKAAKLPETYGVFGKSIGTVLCAQAIEQNIIKPKFLLFVGIPLGYIVDKYQQFGKVLADSQLPITVIHNDHDPVGSSQDVQAYLNQSLSGKPNYKFIETKGDTHDYEDYDLIQAELASFKENNLPNF